MEIGNDTVFALVSMNGINLNWLDFPKWLHPVEYKCQLADLNKIIVKRLATGTSLTLETINLLLPWLKIL